MTDLYLILVPAVLIIVFIGLWIIRGMRPKNRLIGRLVITVTALAAAGLITIAYVSSVVGLILLAVSALYYTRKYYANKTT